MASKKRLPRRAATPKRETGRARPRQTWSSGLDARLKAPPAAGGPIRHIHPTAKALRRLFPVTSFVTVKSGLVPRDPIILTRKIVAKGPYFGGFSWNIPAPDPSYGDIVWAAIAFDWAFYGWQSDTSKNDGDDPIRINGSVQWIWYLTGDPDLFPRAPIFLADSGIYTFYQDLAPGEGGFDAGWLTPPRSASYSSQPDKTDGSMTSPLQRLLAMNVDGFLKLWFTVEYRNETPRTVAIGNPYGPDTLYYAYAYATPFGSAPAG